MNKQIGILPIYEVRYPTRFQFIPLELIDIQNELSVFYHSTEEIESLLAFIKDRDKPKVDGFMAPIYTWDYFAWKDHYNNINGPDRSINEKGLGYCNTCGKMVKMRKVEDHWQCGNCGYFNRKINDHRVKKD